MPHSFHNLGPTIHQYYPMHIINAQSSTANQQKKKVNLYNGSIVLLDWKGNDKEPMCILNLEGTQSTVYNKVHFVFF